MYLVRKAPWPRKKRAPVTPAAAASGTTGDVAESEVTRLSCGIDAFVWPPTGFATVKIFQQPRQADHGARDACTTGLCSHTQVRRLHSQ